MKLWLATALLLLCNLATAEPEVQRDLPTPYLAQSADDSNSKSLVLFLHGYGGNEFDLYGLQQRLPNGPTYLWLRATMTIRPGMFQWFSPVQNPAEYDGDAGDIARSETKLWQFIDQATRKYHSTPGKVCVVGFSQGAMISYYLAMHRPDALTGIAALSGSMLPGLRAQLAKPTQAGALKVFIGHGGLDPIVPLASAITAEKILRSRGIEPTVRHDAELEHGIDLEEVEALMQWLEQNCTGR